MVLTPLSIISSLSFLLIFINHAVNMDVRQILVFVPCFCRTRSLLILLETTLNLERQNLKKLNLLSKSAASTGEVALGVPFSKVPSRCSR